MVYYYSVILTKKDNNMCLLCEKKENADLSNHNLLLDICTSCLWQMKFEYREDEIKDRLIKALDDLILLPEDTDVKIDEVTRQIIQNTQDRLKDIKEIVDYL